MTGPAPPRRNCANSESGSDAASGFRLLAFRFRSLRPSLFGLMLEAIRLRSMAAFRRVLGERQSSLSAIAT